jgi:hypothetical protein
VLTLELREPIADPIIAHSSRTVSILSRAAIENRAIILVAIKKGNGSVWPHREKNITDKRSGRKLALNLGLNGVPIMLHLLKATRADFGDDLTGWNLHLKLSRVTAVAFARSILDVVAGERKTALTVGGACGDHKQNARASSKEI